MKYTTEKPTEPGFYIIRRKGLEPVVCQVWAGNDDTLLAAFTGKARGRSIDDIDSVFPGAEWSAEPIDIGKTEDDGGSLMADADAAGNDIDEQMIVDEDDLEDDAYSDMPD